MNIPENEIVVLDIAGSHARLVCENSKAAVSLTAMGFVLESDQFVRPISDLADRQKLVNDLISAGALFSSGRDWSPAELVDLYQEQGVVSTGYRMITWKNPNQYVIVAR